MGPDDGWISLIGILVTFWYGGGPCPGTISKGEFLAFSIAL
jgi:hypothetical protein